MEMNNTKIVEAIYFPKPSAIFKEIPQPFMGCDEYVKAWYYNGLNIIASVSKYDGQEWLHVSFSRAKRIPDYKDIQLIKRHFIGEDKKAVMVFPEKEFYVNVHPYCLHLFYSPNNPLPEFSDGSGLI